jgi:hypothetical protein
LTNGTVLVLGRPGDSARATECDGIVHAMPYHRRRPRGMNRQDARERPPTGSCWSCCKVRDARSRAPWRFSSSDRVRRHRTRHAVSPAKTAWHESPGRARTATNWVLLVMLTNVQDARSRAHERFSPSDQVRRHRTCHAVSPAKTAWHGSPGRATSAANWVMMVMMVIARKF